MGLFSKPQKEEFSVIEHYFSVEEIAYRYPEQNFLSGSILRVQPGQEAVLVKEGDCDGPYTNGRYVLDVNQLPGLRKLFNKNYTNDSFNCYLYFINKDKPVNVFWGTANHIKVRDSHTGRIVRMFARGVIALSISNSLLFISKLNGQLPSYTSDDIDDFLYGKSIERIISAVSNALQIEKIPFIEIQSHLATLSDSIKQRLTSENVFEHYGLKINEFNLETIDIHEDDFAEIQREENDLERRKREIGLETLEIRAKGIAESDVARAKGFAEADVMKEKGVYYDLERKYDVLQTAAGNQGGISGNSFIGAGIGLGVGLNAGAGLGAAIGTMASGTLTDNKQQSTETTKIICPNCKAQNLSTAKFCNECGAVLVQKGPICPTCGAENASNAKFCNNCGQSLTPQKTNCPTCGAENEANAKFCNGCGTKLHD